MFILGLDTSCSNNFLSAHQILMHETCVIPTDVMKYLNKDRTRTEHIFQQFRGPQGFLGEGLFIFTELKNTGNYFRGAKEQAHNYEY